MHSRPDCFITGPGKIKPANLVCTQSSDLPEREGRGREEGERESEKALARERERERGRGRVKKQGREMGDSLFHFCLLSS
jgi:hypothetical protein